MAKSPKERFTALPLEQQQAFIESLSDEEAVSLVNSWETWDARPEQLPPQGDWAIWLFLAGRGAGKSKAASEWVVGEIQAGRAKRIALVGRTVGDTRDVMVTGQSGILATAKRRGVIAQHEPSKRLITFPEFSAVATTYSADAGASLRGPEFDLAYCDEIAAWPKSNGDDDAWNNLMFGLRIGDHPRLIATTTPRVTKFMRDLLNDPRVAVTRSTTYDNRSNLAPSFLAEIEARYKGTRLGRQELLGELIEDVEGALWQAEWIEANRRDLSPSIALKRIVVAIDPAVSTHTSSDYTGLCISGLGEDDEFYVLHSEQMKVSPHEWASRAIDLYHSWGADKIVAEKNNGGDLVEHTLRSVDRNVALKLIHAKRGNGKHVRAEPVAALYEQSRVHHTKQFDDLEEQMQSFPQVEHDDLVDSLVYAITELANLDAKQPARLYIV